MFFAVPPTVILVPATLAFGVQIAAAVFGLAAVLTLSWIALSSLASAFSMAC
jgi:hypothetical protein